MRGILLFPQGGAGATFPSIPINTPTFIIGNTLSVGVFLVDTTVPRSIILPGPTLTIRNYFLFKDASGFAESNMITFVPGASTAIDGLIANKPYCTNWGCFSLYSGATAWFSV